MKILLMMALLLLSACDKAKPLAKSTVLHRLADHTKTYQRPSPQHKISFPLAHAPKKGYRHEWWYLTANLVNQQGEKLAAQWTLFRTAINDKHLYFAHGALANSSEHFSALRLGRPDFGNLVIKTNPFSAFIDDWSWQSNDNFLSASLNFGDNNLGRWQAQLELTADNRFYLQGDKGYNRKHLTLPIASHYYSQPFIKVTGKVFLNGQWQKVTGDAWFDREWGSQMLAPDQQGWDWFSLRLTPDLALMVYRIRSTKQDHLYGSLMKKDGEVMILSAKHINIKSGSVDNTGYPQQFSLTLAEQDIDLTVKIINNKQIMRFGINYFEGMVDFSGSHQGTGFLEMTGYE
jgi:predicted secreted hydrolase